MQACKICAWLRTTCCIEIVAMPGLRTWETFIFIASLIHTYTRKYNKKTYLRFCALPGSIDLNNRAGRMRTKVDLKFIDAWDSFYRKKFLLG